jgi:hypothetical protein
MYSSEYTSGFSGPVASHLAAPPSPRHEGNVGQAPRAKRLDLLNFRLTQFLFFYSLYDLPPRMRKAPTFRLVQGRRASGLGWDKKRKRVIDVWVIRMDGIDADSDHCLDHFRRREDSAVG